MPAVYRPKDTARTTTAGTPHARANTENYDLEPLDGDTDSEEDTNRETDVAGTLGHQVEQVDNIVLPSKGNGHNKEIAKKEEEISYAEASQQVVENTVHGPAWNC